MELILSHPQVSRIDQWAKAFGLYKEHRFRALGCARFEQASGVLAVRLSNLGEFVDLFFRDHLADASDGAPFLVSLPEIKRAAMAKCAVAFRFDGETATIDVGCSGLHLPALPFHAKIEDFPERRAISAVPATADVGEFARAVCQVRFACSLDPARTVIRHVHFDIERSEVVATDGHRLATRTVATCDGLRSEFIMYQTPAFDLLAKEGQGKLAATDCEDDYPGFVADTEDLSYFAKLVEGCFPDYPHVIPPDDRPTTATILADNRTEKTLRQLVQEAKQATQGKKGDGRYASYLVERSDGALAVVLYGHGQVRGARLLPVEMFTKTGSERFWFPTTITLFHDGIKNGYRSIHFSGLKPLLGRASGGVHVLMALRGDTELPGNILEAANLAR